MSTTGNAMTDAVPPVIAALTLAPGAVIAERYRLEARLGAGSGGTVWRCFDDALQAPVALKIVGAGGEVERWRREVAMARRIAHPNVCRVHDLGETSELRFVTMELVEGDSLRAVIARSVPAAAARDLLAQVVSGVAAIHAAGVVHRDLKPENIVVDRHGRAVIVDFGLARERATGPAVTSAGAVIGTPRYMSPEQAAGQPVDARTDVWALGLIGHELLTRALPAPDEHGRRVDDAADDAWPGSAAVLRRCLAFLPEERFADARALGHALSGLGRRRGARWVVAGAVVATAAAAVVGFLATRAIRDDETPPSAPVRPPAPRMFKLTTTKKWPAEAPVSVALSPDATRIAYTTGNARVLVRPLDGEPVAWSIPSHEKVFVMMWVAGWFGDGSLAVVAASRTGAYQLDRVAPDGTARRLYSHAQRFAAAVSPVGDRVAVAIDREAVFAIAEGAAPEQLAALGRADEVLALAWSPDGARLAVAQRSAETGAGSIRVLAARGAAADEVWRGALAGPTDQLLAWLDDHRLAFASNDLAAQRARLFTVDVRSRDAVLRDDWAGAYVATGSAARGALVVLRGTATPVVQLGDLRSRDHEPLHDPGVPAGRVTGWTTDGRVVFALGAPGTQQIVRAATGRAPEPWPGTREGVERPDTLVGDDLIAHRSDPARRQVVVERITPAGARSELARLPAEAAGEVVVRCAGDRAPPCVLEELAGPSVAWTLIDPATGARGERLHQRLVRDRAIRGAALSPDGRLLAIVDGGDAVMLIDRAARQQDDRPAGEGAVLESVGFAADGELWVTARRFKGRPFGLMVFRRNDEGELYSSPSSRDSASDTLRHFADPRPHPDGKHLAIATLDVELELWRAEGL